MKTKTRKKFYRSQPSEQSFSLQHLLSFVSFCSTPPPPKPLSAYFLCAFCAFLRQNSRVSQPFPACFYQPHSLCSHQFDLGSEMTRTTHDPMKTTHLRFTILASQARHESVAHKSCSLCELWSGWFLLLDDGAHEVTRPAVDMMSPYEDMVHRPWFRVGRRGQMED